MFPKRIALAIDPSKSTGYNSANAMIKRVMVFFSSDKVVGANLEKGYGCSL
ncbi:hypothetical protein Lpp221_03547 [Lacticaseibacillus paracasei subsp. paracasei Lpp221]|jgi:hypothetical protein|uniref:Uncharacterized protein n=5 Tax=Lacticaseibacillus paracasei subsp. paracasei TaxID=47714 RepID=A0A829H7C7_LACPA|nr:hypothetical protein LCAZH_2400 [Lacticaseibacillus paracasei]EKQ03123.1 hypothetical protein LCA211_1256 [Lacticaseibacillus casei 21/1]EPC28517.1 hypothetical protein Lpp46_0367 [Lacticaseibacillus paracasei subsp. paracasei Lpp46]EPC33273.1 hypothetical protein Lpp223_1669 [Lacticaseibacillus paracasei subsp. paracasei Lpp223]EPC56721.1 hypothetical protein Lpp123_04756 [Lacticaseibacillus paracasei subsp. paracasei Lpp123]EPC56888.1 hypothetical protein Lpp77_01227 [Lacticaseibacillus p